MHSLGGGGANTSFSLVYCRDHLGPFPLYQGAGQSVTTDLSATLLSEI